MRKKELRVLAGCCHTATCCPSIMESGESEEIVIVGDALNGLLASPDVKRKIGKGEAAVVIPRALLIEALKSLDL